jgi:hypothetical protein
MARRPARLAAFCLGLGLALAWSGAAWAELQPYSARYSLYRNGKLTGKFEISLAPQENRWILSSEGSGTYGLARILGAHDEESVLGRAADDGRFIPQQYERRTRVAGVEKSWVATFDWAIDRVDVVHDGEEHYRLPLDGRALDPLSLKLEMQRRLAEAERNLDFLMVEEDEIDPQNFRRLDSEWLETALGCLQTIPVEKVRHNSRRYTRAWHAPDFGNVEVRVEHGKRDGDHIEMRITELTWAGERIAARPGCVARQSRATDRVMPSTEGR